MRTTLRGGLAPDVRPGRCAYCGRPCNGPTCAAHSDLTAHEQAAVDVWMQRLADAQQAWDERPAPRAVDRSVETVDRPNGLRSESAT